MTPPGIVPAFDEPVDHRPDLGLGLELPPVERLAFEGGEEAFALRIVVSIADRPPLTAGCRLPWISGRRRPR